MRGGEKEKATTKKKDQKVESTLGCLPTGRSNDNKNKSAQTEKKKNEFHRRKTMCNRKKKRGEKSNNARVLTPYAGAPHSSALSVLPSFFK